MVTHYLPNHHLHHGHRLYSHSAGISFFFLLMISYCLISLFFPEFNDIHVLLSCVHYSCATPYAFNASCTIVVSIGIPAFWRYSSFLIGSVQYTKTLILVSTYQNYQPGSIGYLLIKVLSYDLNKRTDDLPSNNGDCPSHT